MLDENLNFIELITNRAEQWLVAGIAAMPRLALALSLLLFVALLLWVARSLIRIVTARVGLRKSLIDVLNLITVGSVRG